VYVILEENPQKAWWQHHQTKLTMAKRPAIIYIQISSLDSTVYVISMVSSHIIPMHSFPSQVCPSHPTTNFTSCAGFVRQKRAEKSANFCLVKDGTFCPLFCLTKPALVSPPSTFAKLEPLAINVGDYQLLCSC
jgi:hypothetical protein